jgi:hypothetical protein
MVISMKDIIDQYEKDRVRNDDPLEFISKEYKDFTNVFFTVEVDTLVPHKGNANYHIVLKAGIKPD